jgi:hypothetical protein
VDKSLFGVEFIGHRADLVELVKAASVLPARLDAGHHAKQSSEADAVQQRVVSVDEIGTQLNALTCLYGLHLGIQKSRSVQELLENAVPGLAGRTDLYNSMITRNQY